MGDKRKRSSAKGRFTRSVNCLESFLNDPDGDGENAKRYFEDVDDAWKNVEAKHEEYVSALSDDTDLEPEDKWITDVQEKYHEIRKRYVKFKSSCEVLSELKSREKGRAVAFETFSRLLANLKTSVEKKYPIETIQREKVILERQFEVVKNKHSEFSMISESRDERNITEWLVTLIEQFGSVNSIADAYLKSLEHVVSKTKPETVEKLKRNMKMEQMPLPRFYGEPRFYPRFKRDFEELVLPRLENREAVFALRQCLGKNVEAILGSGDFDLKQIFKRLDEKYGDPSKMTDSIMCEIQRFRKIEADDSKRIVEFINLIERAFHDLKSVQMEKEINNTNVVSIIESKLPKYLALNWYRFIHSDSSKVDKSNKFPDLLNYLITERNALEYGMSDLRISIERKTGVINYVKVDDSKCLFHNDDSHKTSECRTYLKMNLNGRYELLRENFACFSCLSPNHFMFECKNKSNCIPGCGKYHHETLHPPPTSETVNTINSLNSSSNACLFPIMRVKVGNTAQYANVLWDCCVRVCLITESKAREFGLEGTPSEISITVVGGVSRSIESKRYKVPLVDLKGHAFFVEAHSINTISGNISELKLSKIKKYFPEIKEEQLKRPKGEVDILIGYNYAAWHPIRERSHKHLLILSNSFGKCVGGSHPDICERTEKNEDISLIVNLISSKVLSRFSIVEALGTEFTPRCGKCKCGNCPLGGMNCTIREERELALIDKNLEFCKEGHWIAGYPWVKDAVNLPNNRSYAVKLLLQIEKRLKRDLSYQKLYSDQIEDMLCRNVARKLTQNEIAKYNGPIHYIAHHAVRKPTSKTTPLRIVFNSSANFQGHVLNEYWAKGPNVFLNSLFGILIRFRENHVGFMGDITKMYNSVRIPLPDQHCHRFLWRGMDDNRKPDTYVITRVNMGDKPSGSIASLALRKTAEMKANEFPEESKIILNSSYMDDIIDSTDTFEKAEIITKNISDILKMGDFHVKQWVISSVSDNSVVFELFHFLDGFERVLGMSWLVQGDLFKYAVKLNFLKGKRSIKLEPDLTIEDFHTKFPPYLTKRMVLSQLNGIYDPLGLLSPFIIRGKLLLRSLWSAEFDWDDKISDGMYQKWEIFFKEMFELNTLSFTRCVKPIDAVRNPMLIIFSDASKEAYGAVCYVRWELSDGTYKATLLLSKSKISPVKAITIVRLELLAAVISTRLRISIEKECRYKFGKIIHIVDSEIVRAMIQRESYGFNTFTSTKIGEIQEGSNPEDWYWVNGENNVADMLTRGETPGKLNFENAWQNGPDFLKLPIDNWPIRKDCSTEVLPEQVETVMKIELNDSEIVHSERFGSFVKLMRVTARILNLKTKPYSIKNISNPITAGRYNEAVLFWVKQSQRSILPELKRGSSGEGKLRKLCPVLRDDGVYVVAGRAMRWFEASYNKSLIPILPKNEFSKLYAEMIHQEKHVGVDSDIAKIRLEFWIIGLQQICKSINNKCVDCRKKRAQLSSQIMGKLPLDRLKPAPPWNSVGIDLFGPFEVRRSQ